MPTYTNRPKSSSLGTGTPTALILVAAVYCSACVQAVGEEFAPPPEWTDDVKNVFFDDAHQALSGDDPPESQSAIEAQDVPPALLADDSIWPELITSEALEAAIKSSIIRATSAANRPARFKAGDHNVCRREFTLLGTLFGVISQYPTDIRWKAAAPQFAQLCFETAEVCAEGSESSLADTQATLAALGELLSGQLTAEMAHADGQQVAELSVLMQEMEQLLEHRLPENLRRPTHFRRQAQDVAEMAQLLAMLSQVIRHEAYGYDYDNGYQAHADALRDSARQLNEAATDKDFEAATQAATAIGRSCADCHAHYRG